jgi:hypothetical protein
VKAIRSPEQRKTALVDDAGAGGAAIIGLPLARMPSRRPISRMMSMPARRPPARSSADGFEAHLYAWSADFGSVMVTQRLCGGTARQGRDDAGHLTTQAAGERDDRLRPITNGASTILPSTPCRR